ncbi:MAG: NAD-dependent epimerase/dehydratase family protein [Actinomycetota bacterium]
MLVFLTGATGFIGGVVAAKLRERGDEVRALVRDIPKAIPLAGQGVELVQGDISQEGVIRKAIQDCDAVIHAAAVYKVGVLPSQHEQMYRTNVEGTEKVLRAALDASTPNVVYVSTIAVFGNTRGRVVDESFKRRAGFTSFYEKTKHDAHSVARRFIDEDGLRCVIVAPGVVYGWGDTSEVGKTMRKLIKRRLPMVPFAKAGFNFVYVDDVADGILLALDKGRNGEEYVLGGEIGTMGGMLAALSHALGRNPSRLKLPTALVKAFAPLGESVGRLMGYPPNLRELITSLDGVTFWAKHDKAMQQLGYSPRSLEQGMKDMLVRSTTSSTSDFPKDFEADQPPR